MKIQKIYSIVFIFLIASASAAGQYGFKVIPNFSYKAGEQLTFELRYGFLVGGTATLTLEETVVDDKVLHHAVMDARTVGLTDKLFRVRDIYESYFFPKTGLPYKAIRNISEGNYKFYNEVYFNHDSSTVMSSKSGLHEVPQNILDMVSVLYYIRRIDYSEFSNGDVIKVDTYFSDELFPFDIRYRGMDWVETELGKFKCHKFVPIVEPGRIFEDEDDMTIWITADQNQLPIMVKFDMVVGSFKCELIDHKNIRYPL